MLLGKKKKHLRIVFISFLLIFFINFKLSSEFEIYGNVERNLLHRNDAHSKYESLDPVHIAWSSVHGTYGHMEIGTCVVERDTRKMARKA